MSKNAHSIVVSATSIVLVYRRSSPFPFFVSLARHKSSHADTLGKRTNVALRRVLSQNIGIDGT
jgi:hypothetical protein